MREPLIQIAKRAATLDERLQGVVLPCPEETSPDQVAFRIDKWKHNVSNGEDSIFQKRLELDGIDKQKLNLVLGDVRLPDPNSLPEWVHMLEELIRSTEFVDRRDQTKRTAFDELLFGYVKRARSKLQPSQIPMTSEAMESFELVLLLEFSRVCSRPLALELNIASMQETLTGETPEARYYDFIRRLATPNGMLSFFLEYPVAGRLIAGAALQWIDSTNEFLSRLQNDLPDIAVCFNEGHAPGNIVAISDRISDTHNYGRTSKKVTFDSGFRVIYKPKDLTLDETFQNLLEWINVKKKLLPLKTFRVLNRKTHGWVEFLEPSSCREVTEIDAYFERAGMLLCLAHALGATDCHHENIFACGEYPVLIDLETLLEVHPMPPQNRPQNADELALESCRLSLMYTGMLPRLVFGNADKSGGDFSGLFGGKEQQYPFRIPDWVDSETDQMRLEFSYKSVKFSTNRPMLNDKEVSAGSYQEKVEQGFEKMYSFLLEVRDQLSNDGLLDRLCAGEVRFLNRATVEYALIVQKSLDPTFLRDGIDRSIHLELLFRNVFLQDRESTWNLVKEERQSLERLDIPYFSANAKSSVLMSSRQQLVPDVSLRPARDRLLQRLSLMSPQEMKKQILFLRGSWSIRSGSNSGRRQSPGNHENSYAEDADKAIRSELIQAAKIIGETIKASAIRSVDGTVTWIGAEYVPHLNQFSIVPMGSFLYSGKSGTALFLAALDRFVPGQGYGELALAALKTIRQRFRGDKAKLYTNVLGLGAMSGIGSICWTLLQIHELLSESNLVEDAAAIGSLITPDLIARDRHLDFMAGSAGAILCLLALDRAIPQADFRSRAEECGKYLLEQSIQPAPGLRAWQSVRGEQLTGFSHGAAGYAYALLRLHDVTGREEYKLAALQAFEYERSLFSRERKNWPDLRIDERDGSEQRFMTGWCHGAPGIVLSRIGSLPFYDSPEIRNEIENGLQTTLQAQLKPNDDTCCGNFSRIETLLIASQHLNRKDLRDAALSRASKIVRLSSGSGKFRVDPDIGDDMNPGFMKGIAGIGFALLRLADENDQLQTPLLMCANISQKILQGGTRNVRSSTKAS